MTRTRPHFVSNVSPHLAVGVTTPIYDDPVTRHRYEGLAIIREIDERHSSPEFTEARVEFLDEPGQHYNRRIYRY